MVCQLRRNSMAQGFIPSILPSAGTYAKLVVLIVATEMDIVEHATAAYRQANPNAALAVALIRPEGTCTYYSGADAQSRFEIGSISKLFTAILTAQAVVDGKANLDDAATRFLPWSLQRTTLRALLNHSSGYPRLPLTMTLSGELFTPQPYARWNAKRLRRSLFVPTMAPSGARFKYSNFGYAVLGLVLERLNGESYGAQIDHWTKAHAMADTTIEAAPERDLPGHDVRGTAAASWQMAAFAPAGGIRSSLADMIQFAQLCLNDPEPAIRLSQTEQRTLGLRYARGIVAQMAVVFLPLLLASFWIWPTSLSVPTWIVTLGGLVGQWELAATLGVVAVFLASFHGAENALWMAGVALAVTILLGLRRGPKGRVTLGLGWHVMSPGEDEILWHNGGTAGFRSFLGMSPKSGVAVIVLSSCGSSVDEIGLNLLARGQED